MRFAFLKISLCVLAASTWVFWSFVFATRPDEAPAIDSAGDALESLVRLPASLPGQIPGIAAPASRIPEPIEMDVVTVPCWEKSSESQLGTSARWIRLTGRNCGAELKPDLVSVRNLTNGYMATVFATAHKSMTTDFIPLQAGQNEILIRFDQGDGSAVESQLHFVRE